MARRIGRVARAEGISDIEPQIKTTMTDIVKQLAALPQTVMYDGIEFQFKLFNNGTDDIRITYEIFDVLYGDFWDNPFIGMPCSFLYLYENISNEADLRNAIADCREFLITNNIWKP